MIQAYASFWKNYVNFKGRASRGQYWWVVLANALINVVLMTVYFTQLSVDQYGYSTVSSLGAAASGISALYALAVIIPTLSLSIRRLHDTGRSVWWYLINFVPCVGGIIFFVFTCLAGTDGNNQYGPDPRRE